MQTCKNSKNKKTKYNIAISRKKIAAILLSTALAVSSFASAKKAQAAPDCPGDILDLSSWKITLPTGDGKPTEIKQPTLADYTTDPYFKICSSGDGVVFRAPVNGATTSNSGYPRSELREMKNGGKDMANWSTTDGRHTMFIDQTITAVPKDKKHIVVGQVHDSEDDVIVVRLEYPKLFVDINGKTGPTLDPNYTLGKRFTVKFVAEKGQIKIYYNGNTNPAYTLDKKASGCYFKAGAYTQSNCDKESSCSSANFGEVIIYRLLLNQENLESQLAPQTSEPVLTQETAAPKPEENQIPGSETVSETPKNDSNQNTAPESQNSYNSDEASNPKPVLSVEPFEAESGTAKGGMRVMDDDPSASGGKYILAESSGSVEYIVNIPEKGKYRIAGSIKAPNKSADSFKVLINNKKSSTWTLARSVADWKYDLHDGKVFSLSQGEHKITLKYREKGAKIDKLVLVKK